MGEVRASTTAFTLEEARATEIPPEARRLLSPEEIGRLCVVPLTPEASDGSITVAADPSAPENVERMLRAQLGVRRVEIRRASREAMEILIAAHLAPLWKERGWQFAGLPRLAARAVEQPVAKGPAPMSIETPRESTTREGCEPRDSVHPVVLFLETDEERRQSLSHLLIESGYEPRFASSLEDVAREVRVSPPAAVIARRDASVPLEALVSLVRKAGGSIELRVLKDYARALIGADGDDRLPSFLFDLVRFFVGVIAAVSGGSLQKSESRARAAESAARSLGLKPQELEAARLSVLFADLENCLPRLGSGPQGPGSSTAAVSHEGLAQLLDPARTPFPIRAALEGRRERYDGTGPGKLAGESIPPAARVLAAVDAFYFHQTKGAAGAMLETILRAEAGKSLDPRAVEAVLRADRAERLVDSLGSSRERVLIVDADPIAASLLEMRLSNAGFEVTVCRDGENALSAAARGGVDLVISEVGVPKIDGLTLLLRMRRLEATREIPFIFVSDRTDRASTVKALELGADDYLTKPPDLELLTAKVKGIVRKARDRKPSQPAADGVSGSLSELDLADLLQVLGASRRTVRVQVAGGEGQSGELILDKGRLVHAVCGALRGAEAFFEIFCWHRGRFTLRAIDSAHERTIDVALEFLLLEGCRQRDDAERRQMGTVPKHA